MLRITLLEDFGKSINLRFGHEVRVPMSFGSITPELTADFSKRDEPLPAEPRIWPLSWTETEDSGRSVLIPNEVGVHYFGDWRAGTDMQAVRAKLIPSFNDERERVARTWGDYFYSDRKANGELVKYATIRIHIPVMPKVEIAVTNAAGTPVGEFRFRPHDHWKFEEILDAEAAVLWGDLLSRRGQLKPAAPSPALERLANLTPQQIEKLLTMADKAFATK